MKQTHVKNHFVPEVYLKNWVNTKGKLEAYKLLVPHENVKLWKSHSPSAIGWQRHLYTRMIAGEENDEFEDWFSSEYEAPAESAIKKAINDQKLTPKDWDILIRFLAAQDVRTPNSLLNYLKTEDKVIGDVLKKNLEDTAKKMMSDNFQEYLISNEEQNINDELPLKLSFYHDHKEKTVRIKAKTYTGRKSWLFLIKGVLNNHIDSLTNQRWTIVKPAKDYNFFTSDNPVVKFNYRKPGDYDLDGTWINKKANIIFPLSPCHAMLTEIGSKNTLMRGTRLSSYHTNEVREFIANNAHRYIFSQNIDYNIVKLRSRTVDIEHYLNEKSQIETWHEKNKELELAYESEKIEVFHENN